MFQFMKIMSCPVQGPSAHGPCSCTFSSVCSSSLTGTRGHRDTSPDLEGHVHLPFPLLGLPPSVSVSPFLSFFLSLPLSLSLLLSFSGPSVSLCLSLSLSFSVSLPTSLSPSLSLSACLSFSLSSSLSPFLSASPSLLFCISP